MDFNEFVNLILEWHRDNEKKFSWRENRNPYKVLISELLLQKTDSKKVKKLYSRFIEKFPTTYHLYQAKPEEIDDLIKDIGLLYREQRLRKIAEQVINEFNGRIPDNKEDIMSLYGVGDYIANAVLCFAFDKRVPIVDTNVIRIYERVFNVKSSKSRPRTDKEIWNFAEKVLPEKNYREYNYTIIDFASDICKAKKPLCHMCPITDICYYYQVKEENESQNCKESN
jgi:A/G-specific adenine glycosylase